jgi:hypothetical protein
MEDYFAGAGGVSAQPEGVSAAGGGSGPGAGALQQDAGEDVDMIE